MSPWRGTKDAHEEDTLNFLFAGFNGTYFPPEKGCDFHLWPKRSIQAMDVSIPPLIIHTFLMLWSLPSSFLHLFSSLLFFSFSFLYNSFIPHWNLQLFLGLMSSQLSSFFDLQSLVHLTNAGRAFCKPHWGLFNHKGFTRPDSTLVQWGDKIRSWPTPPWEVCLNTLYLAFHSLLWLLHLLKPNVS